MRRSGRVQEQTQNREEEQLAQQQRAQEQLAQEQRARQQRLERLDQQTRARQQARALEIQRLRAIEQQEVMGLEIRVPQLVNRVYHRTDISHQVERLSDGHLGRDRERAASEKLSQLKQEQPDRSRIQEITDIIESIVQIRLLSLKIREATTIIDEYIERDIANLPEADRTRFNRANDARNAARRDLQTLNGNFNTLINYQPPNNPVVRENEALEVHREAAKVGTDALDKLLEVLDNNSEYSGDITEYVKEKFEAFINGYSGYDKDKKKNMKKDLVKVLNKLKSAGDVTNDPRVRKLIGNIVDFVIAQPDDFKDSYISSYIHDCANAYMGAQGDAARISCVNGIVERFYLILAQYLSTLCPGTEQTCPPIYRRINKALNKTAYEDNNELKNEFIQEWASKHLKEDHDKDERKQSFIDFMQGKYKELYGVKAGEELEEPTINMINELAKQYEYAFESGMFGGVKKIRRKRTMKKSKKRKARKSRKH